MCSQADEPTGWADPTPQRPRKYALSGDGPRPSVALAVLGTLITEWETAYEDSWGDHELWLQLDVLREARRRVGEAEAAL